MIKLATAYGAPAAKNQRAVSVALLYAVILVVFIVSQLFSFEKFLPLVGEYELPGGQPFAYFLAAYIVMAEIFALPFLLRMKLSTVMRFVSMVMGWIVALLWVFIAIWLVVTASTVTTIGFFGDILPFAPGLESVAVGYLLLLMSLWATWGMWPSLRRK